MEFELGQTYEGYQFLERLRSSRDAMEYRVHNTVAQRQELMRVLPKTVGDDQDAAGSFLREARILARLTHPHIIGFYTAQPIDGRMAMTTEWSEFVPLTARLGAGPLPCREALDAADQLLSALACLHGQSVVHLDVTPDNILCSPAGSWKLANFAMARVVNGVPLHGGGAVSGSPRYVSPEQVKGGTLDYRSDLYSFAVVLYEMLCGRPPFDSKSQFELMLAHVSGTPEPPSRYNPALPGALDEVLLRGLAKEPGDRHASAADFAAALVTRTIGLNGRPGHGHAVEVLAEPPVSAEVNHDVASVDVPEVEPMLLALDEPALNDALPVEVAQLFAEPVLVESVAAIATETSVSAAAMAVLNDAPATEFAAVAEPVVENATEAPVSADVVAAALKDVPAPEAVVEPVAANATEAAVSADALTDVPATEIAAVAEPVAAIATEAAVSADALNEVPAPEFAALVEPVVANPSEAAVSADALTDVPATEIAAVVEPVAAMEAAVSADAMNDVPATEIAAVAESVAAMEAPVSADALNEVAATELASVVEPVAAIVTEAAVSADALTDVPATEVAAVVEPVGAIVTEAAVSEDALTDVPATEVAAVAEPVAAIVMEAPVSADALNEVAAPELASVVEPVAANATEAAVSADPLHDVPATEIAAVADPVAEDALNDVPATEIAAIVEPVAAPAPEATVSADPLHDVPAAEIAAVADPVAEDALNDVSATELEAVLAAIAEPVAAIAPAAPVDVSPSMVTDVPSMQANLWAAAALVAQAAAVAPPPAVEPVTTVAVSLPVPLAAAAMAAAAAAPAPALAVSPAPATPGEPSANYPIPALIAASQERPDSVHWIMFGGSAAFLAIVILAIFLGLR